MPFLLPWEIRFTKEMFTDLDSWGRHAKSCTNSIACLQAFLIPISKKNYIKTSLKKLLIQEQKFSGAMTLTVLDIKF